MPVELFKIIDDLNFNESMLCTLPSISLKVNEEASNWSALPLSFSLGSYPPPPSRCVNRFENG